MSKSLSDREIKSDIYLVQFFCFFSAIKSLHNCSVDENHLKLPWIVALNTVSLIHIFFVELFFFNSMLCEGYHCPVHIIWYTRVIEMSCSKFSSRFGNDPHLNIKSVHIKVCVLNFLFLFI